MLNWKWLVRRGNGPIYVISKNPPRQNKERYNKNTPPG
jgi:hypothetical protein